jgi:hypothetical protein
MSPPVFYNGLHYGFHNRALLPFQGFQGIELKAETRLTNQTDHKASMGSECHSDTDFGRLLRDCVTHDSVKGAWNATYRKWDGTKCSYGLPACVGERRLRSERRSRRLLGVRHLPDIAGVCSPIFAE